MSSCPTISEILSETTTSFITQNTESPSISADTNYNSLDLQNDLNDLHITSESESISTKNDNNKKKVMFDDEKTPLKRLTLTTSTSHSNTLEHKPLKAKTKKKVRPKHSLKRGTNSKSVAYHEMDEHETDKIGDLPNNKRKKTKFKKRKSFGNNIHKQLQKHLSTVNQYLLPAPKKSNQYKWYQIYL